MPDTPTDTAVRCPLHGIPDCSPLLNGCSWKPDARQRIRDAVADIAFGEYGPWSRLARRMLAADDRDQPGGTRNV